MVGNGLDSGAPRAGALLRASALIPKTPLFPALSVAFAVVPSNSLGVSARWITLGAGLGVRAGLVQRTIALEARIEAIADSVGGSATDASGASDSGGRRQPGARAGIGATWMFVPRVGLSAGVNGDLVRSGTVVRIHNQPSSRAAPGHIQGLLGVRIGWL